MQKLCGGPSGKTLEDQSFCDDAAMDLDALRLSSDDTTEHNLPLRKSLEDPKISVSEETTMETFTVLKCNDQTKLTVFVSVSIPDTILLRQSTVDIMKLILDQREESPAIFTRRAVVTGTPGVGKTVSIIAWLYLIIHEKQTTSYQYIVVELADFTCDVLSRQKDGSWTGTSLPRAEIQSMYLQFKDTLYLYDATLVKQPSELPFALSVVFSSPNKHHFKNFAKPLLDGSKSFFYTPKWTLSELMCLYQASEDVQGATTIEDIKALFKIWGGLPRQILRSEREGKAALDKDIGSCDARACLNHVSQCADFVSYTDEDAQALRTKLMHYELANPNDYRRGIINFGSLYIRDEMIKKVRVDALTNYYENTRGRDGLESIRGHFYEQLVLQKLKHLKDDLEVLCFNLGEDEMTTITIPAAKHQQTEESYKNFSSLDDVDPNKKCFWIPCQSNFESFDLLINTTHNPLWCQVTVGKEHSLSAKGARNCLNELVKSEIVFVLPPDMFAHWFKQNNKKQPFVTKNGKIATAAMFDFLKTRDQMVICVPTCEQDDQLVVDMKTSSVGQKKIVESVKKPKKTTSRATHTSTLQENKKNKPKEAMKQQKQRRQQKQQKSEA